MKVIFVINTFLFRMRVKANWNLPHLPRIGERISPHVIMFQEEFTYHNVLKYLTDEAKNDFNKFNDKDRKSTRLNSSHIEESRMPSSA